MVDDRLTTSRPDIFALGDCAEIQGKLMPYLQPAQLAAMTLAKNLTGNSASLSLPAMLVRIKTPDLPLHGRQRRGCGSELGNAVQQSGHRGERAGRRQTAESVRGQ